MNNKKSLCAAILIAACTHAAAQTMYRCGNTYSQSPCGADASELKAAGVPQPIATSALEPLSPDRHEQVKATCEHGIRTRPSWKDRETLKIGEIRRGKRSEVVTLNGKRQSIVPWYAIVNARNSYGAYIGERIVDCYFDSKEDTLLDVYVRKE